MEEHESGSIWRSYAKALTISRDALSGPVPVLALVRPRERATLSLSTQVSTDQQWLESTCTCTRWHATNRARERPSVCNRKLFRAGFADDETPQGHRRATRAATASSCSLLRRCCSAALTGGPHVLVSAMTNVRARCECVTLDHPLNTTPGSPHKFSGGTQMQCQHPSVTWFAVRRTASA